MGERLFNATKFCLPEKLNFGNLENVGGELVFGKSKARAKGELK